MPQDLKDRILDLRPFIGDVGVGLFFETLRQRILQGAGPVRDLEGILAYMEASPDYARMWRAAVEVGASPPPWRMP